MIIVRNTNKILDKNNFKNGNTIPNKKEIKTPENREIGCFLGKIKKQEKIMLFEIKSLLLYVGLCM